MADHIARLDAGVAYAVDDLAVALRVLLCEGAGTGILLRAIEEFGVPQPDVLRSEPPYAGATFSVASVPLVEWFDGLETEQLVLGPLKTWLDQPVIGTVNSDTEKRVSWTQFLKNYCNKLGGAHIDADAWGSYLEQMDFVGVGRLALSGFLLKAAGVQGCLSTQEVLQSIISSMGVEGLDGAWLGGSGSTFEPPAHSYEEGFLTSFAYNDDGMKLTWFVDEQRSENRIRLFYDDAVWDYTYTVEKGLKVEKPLSPLDTFAFQSPRNPNYPPQMIDGVHMRSRPYMHLARVRTLAELRDGEPFRYPHDFNPLLIPGWGSTNAYSDVTFDDDAPWKAEVAEPPSGTNGEGA